MNKFIVFVAIFAISAGSAEETCYKEVVEACISTTKKAPISSTECSARFGGITHAQSDLQVFANHHINKSFEYLLMSTHYANYEKNRPGFEKLYRGLSDHAWNKAIEVIKYINKRGGEMNFFNKRDNEAITPNNNYELYEYQSIAKALDIEKQLAREAFHIHSQVTKRDPGIANYLEGEFIERQEGIIRTLSGYANDLKSLLTSSEGPKCTLDNGPLSLYLFDEYLQKQ